MVVAVLGWYALGMPGMDHSTAVSGEASDRAMTDMSHEADGRGWVRQTADDFAGTITRDDVLVVNVHVPDEGSLAGTDVDIPFHGILGDPRLPGDRAAPIALYCKSGRMSATAARALTDAGYTDVVELEGGMDSWARAGRPVDP